MGRELQKRKNRSGVAKVRQKPKSKKKILNNPIIAANWDKTQSLAQNYKRLGLTAKLNKTTGGIERKVSDVLREAEEGERHQDNLQISTSSKRKETLDVTEAKIERDPKTGKILRVVDDANTANLNPLNDPLNELDSESEDELLNPKNQHGNTDAVAARGTSNDDRKTETVRKLEEEARKPAAKYERRQPEGEVLFVEELVRTYGDDYGKMARDMKINYMQRSEGDIKRRVKKWRESGGVLE